MNTVRASNGTPSPEAADYVDFKWLMAGEGYRIDAQRMQTDREYARRCAELAQRSMSPITRALARWLVSRLTA